MKRKGISFKKNLSALLFLNALQNMPFIRFLVLDYKYVVPRFRKGINSTFENISVPSSLLRPGKVSKIFSLHYPIPFHKALIVTREKRTHSSA